MALRIILPHISTDAHKYYYLREIFFRYLNPKADASGSAGWSPADVVDLLIIFAPYLKPALDNPGKFVVKAATIGEAATAREKE